MITVSKHIPETFASYTFHPGTWTDAYSLASERQIKKNQLLTTIPLLMAQWKVSFEFKASTFGSTLQQILHMTTGGKGTGRGSKYGDRTPAIWTDPKRGFLISSAVNGRYSYAKYFNKKWLPSTNEWINIEVGQELDLGRMIYYIIIGGTKVFSITNTKPSEFKDVKFFTSSRWYSSLTGSIRNLLIQNKDNGLYLHPPINWTKPLLKVLTVYSNGHLRFPFRASSCSRRTHS